jgi:hypothetical protein
MTLNQLRRAIDRQPFVPFRLVLVAGGWKEYDVPDRATIEMAEEGVVIHDQTGAERWLDPRLIAAIEFYGPVRRRPDQNREGEP